MSKETKTTKTNKANKAPKWDNLQKTGFWVLVVTLISFWSGVYLGNLAATTAQKELEQAKTSAVEEYKATLKQ